jgi:hypothetical protein
MVDEMVDAYLRDYYCLRWHHKSYAQMVALERAPDKKRGGLLRTFDDVDADAWQRMKLLSDSAFRWLFERRQVSVFMTCRASTVAMKSDTEPMYRTPREYVKLGMQPKLPEAVRYGVNNVVYLRAADRGFKAQLVRKNRINGEMVDTHEWDVGPVYWHSFCQKVGIDPTLVPGV